MNSLLLHFKKMDWALILIFALLSIVGLVSLYSSSLRSGDFGNLEKQAIFFGVGIVMIFVFSFFDWRVFRENSSVVLAFYFISIILLIGVYFFSPEIRGVRTWYKIGPLALDPIEIAKLALLVVLAKYFSSRHVLMYQSRHILLSGAYVLALVALIFFQPNLGPCLVILSLWAGMLVVSGIKMRHFLALVLVFAVVFAAGWQFLLKDYQKERVMSFFVPYDPLGISWSQNQSKIAVGIGGAFGAGIGKGTQTQYGFLSEPQTDFIFSAIAEEAGLAGVFAVLLLYLGFLWRLTRIALGAQDNFSRLFVCGFAILAGTEAFIHIGVNIGLLPIIGLPLPLVSYGGSSFLATCVAIGIVQAIWVNPRANIFLA
jgi:rod shape determining protein RodA